MTNHIHIAFSFDNEYIGQSGVSIHSILKNVYEYDCIHILDDCISKKNKLCVFNNLSILHFIQGKDTPWNNRCRTLYNDYCLETRWSDLFIPKDKRKNAYVDFFSKKTERYFSLLKNDYGELMRDIHISGII